MPLRGKAKRDYQREYMRKVRGLTNEPTSNLNVRPDVQLSVIPNTRYTLPHFGEVKSRHYARLFFDSIGANHGS
uniref:Uncharacterized protein n=1 Tax=viral metagenome TaxID=1070528 RepID=A0A6H1ZTC1_9ZZZZ